MTIPVIGSGPLLIHLISTDSLLAEARKRSIGKRVRLGERKPLLESLKGYDRIFLRCSDCYSGSYLFFISCSYNLDLIYFVE